MFLSAKLLLEEFPATVEVALIGELLLRWDTSESSSAQSIVKGLEAFFSREYMTELAASVDAYVLQRVLQLMSPPSKSAATTFADFLSIVGAPEVSRAVALRHAATVLTTLPLEAFSLKRENMLSKYPTLVPLLLEKADKHKKARSE